MVRRTIVRNWMKQNVWEPAVPASENEEDYRVNTHPVRKRVGKGYMKSADRLTHLPLASARAVRHLHPKSPLGMARPEYRVAAGANDGSWQSQSVI